jgi:hypothetical protein
VYGPTIESATGIGTNGVAKFHVKLTPAGGDRYKFKAKSSKGTVLVCKDEIETRRKLYYQVIAMSGASKLSKGDLSAVEDEFWNPKKKVYLQLEQYSPGATILNLLNFNDEDASVRNAVKDAARAVYDRSKAPFAAVVVLVNKNCIPRSETGKLAAVADGSEVFVDLIDPLFTYADPAEQWFVGMTFTPNGGAATSVPSSCIRPDGFWRLGIDTSKLPQGPGLFDYTVVIVGIVGMGLSLTSENLVTVASRSVDNSKVPTRTMAAILVHELGHKIGMVPGPEGDTTLDEQGSYYDNRGHSGGHCRNPAPLQAQMDDPSLAPAPKCTMFGDIRTNTQHFCSLCVVSVRKLDVSPERKPGIENQF